MTRSDGVITLRHFRILASAVSGGEAALCLRLGVSGTAKLGLSDLAVSRTSRHSRRLQTDLQREYMIEILSASRACIVIGQCDDVRQYDLFYVLFLNYILTG